MNHPSDHNRDALTEWLDAQVTNSTPPATPRADADLASMQTAATWLRHKAINGERYARATAKGPSHWETIMHAHTTSLAQPASTPVRAVNDRLAAVFHRWQAAVSLAVVVAVLVSLMGIAWQRGILDGPPSTPEGQMPALAQEGTPIGSSYCVPRTTPRMTSTELEAMSLSDWPTRHYTGIGPASVAQGQATLNAYIGWQQCQAAWTQNTADPNVYASPEILSFYSDRLQYIVLASTFTDPRDSDVAQYTTSQTTINQIVLGVPLPVNVTLDPDETFPISPGYVQHAFSPNQVFKLSDGRFGVVTGSLQMSDLLLDQVPSDPPNLSFYAFTEVDGQMYLDEFHPFCAADVQDTLNGEVVSPLGNSVCEEY